MPYRRSRGRRSSGWCAAIVIAHTTPPFADLPPLWKLGLEG
ncbi:hypothetical protein [Bradyrhizobium pachyrhizi]